MMCWLKRSSNPIFLIPSDRRQRAAVRRHYLSTTKSVFNAFRFTELGDVKVVILGRILITDQDRRMVWHFPFAPACDTTVTAEYV